MNSGANSGRFGDPRIRVAVLDGPIDLSHPCLDGSVIEVLAASSNGDANSAAAAHGLHVASIIFGQPGSQTPGLAPKCTGLSVPIFRSAADGRVFCSQADLAFGVTLALEHRAHVINISGGQLSEDGDPEPLLADALRKCEDAGVLVVAAAGNDGGAFMHVPAAIPTVLSVGAAGMDGEPLAFSNWGAPYAANGVLAPGEDIECADVGGATTRRTGSSFAAAVVTGVAARMLSELLARAEAARPLDVRAAILRAGVGAPPGDPPEKYLNGRLNVFGTNQQIRWGSSAMTAMPDTIAKGPEAFPAGAAMGAVHAQAFADDIVASEARVAAPPSVQPSDCGCGCGGAKAEAPPPRPVYALGTIGFDFGSEARRDSIQQFFGDDPLTTETLIAYLAEHEEERERVIWTLNLDATPIYVLQPAGAFADKGYETIFNHFVAQVRAEQKQKDGPFVWLVAAPGRIAGSARLLSGESVPVLLLSSRGVVGWNPTDAVNRFVEINKLEDREAATRFLTDFSNIVTRKYRNLGLLSSERALNYAATAVFRAFSIVQQAGDLGLIIDDVIVLRSAACRTGSECYDVQLRLFVQSDVTAALHIFQFTVDVSDTIPVSIGAPSNWRERPKG